MIKQSTNQKTPGAQNVASPVEDKKERGNDYLWGKKQAEKEVEEERIGLGEEEEQWGAKRERKEEVKRGREGKEEVEKEVRRRGRKRGAGEGEQMVDIQNRGSGVNWY